MNLIVRKYLIRWTLWGSFLLLIQGLPLPLTAQKSPGSGPYEIRGRISGADGKTIYLFNDISANPLDSALIARGGFTFRGKLDSIGLFALFIKGLSVPFVTILTPGRLDLVTSLAKFPLAQVKGSPESEAMAAYQEEFAPLARRAKALNLEVGGIGPQDTAQALAFRASADSFNQEVSRTGLNFIRSHKRQIASVLVLMNELRSRLSPGELDSLYQALDPEVRNSKYGRAAGQYIADKLLTAEGSLAPDFTLHDVNGKPVRLSSFRGHYVLVDFWASWCGPCRAENPKVVAAYKEFHQKNFTVLGVSLDQDRAKWLQAIREDKLTWTQVSDLQGWQNAAAVQYNIQSIPSNLLLDPEGRILAKNLRGEDLENELQTVLNDPRP